MFLKSRNLRRDYGREQFLTKIPLSVHARAHEILGDSLFFTFDVD